MSFLVVEIVLLSVKDNDTGSFPLFPQTTRSPDLWMKKRVSGARVEWRCVMGISGAPCASVVGIWRMLQWFVESSTAALCWTFQAMLVLDGPVEKCCGGMWNARVMSLPWICVNAPSMMMCVHTAKMLEWNAQVRERLKDLYLFYASRVCSCSYFFLQPGKLLAPTLSIQSPFYTYSAGEAVHFKCTAPYWQSVIDFHLYKRGVDTPLVTQRADPRQMTVDLILSDLEISHQGSYSCLYKIHTKLGNSPSGFSPNSNFINITVCKSHLLLNS